MSIKNSSWEHTITPKTTSFVNQINSIWEYKDLLIMLIRRDTLAFYKQTIFGPAWFLFQPLATSIAFYLMFSRVANLDTFGVPGVLFYMAGINIWSFFSEIIVKTATVFKDNQSIFGKVYFPRLIVPLSAVFSGLFKYCIQFGLFILFYLYLIITSGGFTPKKEILLLPFLVILIAFLGLGLGLIISALTVKYRDLVYLLNFGIQLFMYATPVVYSLANIESARSILQLNPLSAIFETYRYGLFGIGAPNFMFLGYSLVFTLFTVLIGVFIFNRTEKSVMDVI